MKKSWGLIPKILDGRKKIESRWGKNKCSPWGRIKRGDTIYFKNAGEPVTVSVRVREVKQFENLTPGKVRKILERYGGDDGISVSSPEETIEWAKDKRYCTLIFLKEPKNVEPFNIDKRGFGTAAAWITIPNIRRIKKS